MRPVGLPEVGDFVVFHDDRGLIVRLRGEHDSSNSGFLATTLVAAMAASDDDLRVDLSGVHFMSCATVGVIVMTNERLRGRDRLLTVLAPSACALRLLRLCDLERLVEHLEHLVEHEELEDSFLPHTQRTGALALSSWVEVPAAARRDRPDRSGHPKDDVPSTNANACERALTDGG